MSNGSKVFTVLVNGENPSELMSRYSKSEEVEKYIKYKYRDANKLRTKHVEVLDKLIEKCKSFSAALREKNQFLIDNLTEDKNHIKNQTDFEYYSNLVSGLYIDDEGNAWSTENPNGKFDTFSLGKNLCIPLILIDGSESFSARKGDVDWGEMHLRDWNIYELTWDLVKGGKDAVTEQEKLILKNMQNKENYFARFKNKEMYAMHNSAYWNYAFVDENGWVDLDDAKSDFEWISTYYDRFISPLPNDAKITVFECSRRD